MDRDVFREDLLAGNHSFITGGSSGINYGIARRMAEKGANLSLVARTQEDLDRAAGELRENFGIEARGFSADVRNSERLKEVVEESVAQLGPINSLICGAAGNFPAEASGMSANAFGSVIDIDLKGTFNACRQAYEHLEKPGASIVAISATQSTQPTPFQSHACSAKAGVDSLVRNLALEWGSDGIRVNAIQPGPIDETEGMKRLLPDEGAKKRVADVLPAGRLGDKRDVADLVLYLTAPASEFLTGAVIPVDGGQSLVGSGRMMDQLTQDS